MHTVEWNFSNFVIEYLGEIETEFNFFCLFIMGPDRFESWKKMEVKNIVTPGFE